MLRRPLSSLCSALLLLIPAGRLAAQAQPKFGDDEPKVELRARFAPASAPRGSRVTLRVEAKIAEGFHVYGAAEKGSPTQLVIDDAGGLVPIGLPVIPAGTRHELAPGLTSHWIAGSAVLTQELEVPADAEGGAKVTGRVVYMACTESMCLPEAEVEFRATLRIAKVKLTARFDPPNAKSGQEVDFVIDVTVDEGWHVYGSAGSDPPITFVATDALGIARRAEVRVPPGDPHETVPGTLSAWLTGSFELRQRMRVADDRPDGPLRVVGDVQYMACNESMCLPPDQVTVSAELKIGDAASAGATPPVVAPPATGSTSAAPPVYGSWGALLVAAFLAGLLALAMPCTYPMIPITFSFFTKQADARGGRVLPLALVYGLGIVTIFVVIGAAAAPLIVPFAQHWLTNAVIGVVFVVFAIALFGWITLEPPRFLQDIAGKASTKGGYFGVFLMGLCLVVASFTCTVPFVGTMLTLAAQGGLVQVVGGMAVFGLTMALPFVFLALIPGRVRAMPRAGEWMNTLKVTLGFIELAAALKFFSNVDLVVNGGIKHAWVSRELFYGSWCAILLAAALHLFGVFSRGARIGLVRRVIAALLALLAAYFGLGASGRPLHERVDALAPPMLREARHVIVEDDIPAAFARAKAEKKLLLLNFTGLSCVNCRLIEEHVFTRPEVADLLEKGFVEGRLHDENQRELGGAAYERYLGLRDRLVGTVAIPDYVVVDPDTEAKLGFYQPTGPSSDGWAKDLVEMLTRALAPR